MSSTTQPVPVVPPVPPVAPPAPVRRVSLGERFRRWLLEPTYPLAAVEVRPRSVGAVRVSKDHGRWVLGAAASLTLPDGALNLSMVQPNVVDPVSFRETIRGLLERAGIPLSGMIGLVLPDPVARVSVMPATEFIGKDSAEVEELLRFRLKKAVPFDIKEASLAFVIPEGQAEGGVAVAAAVSKSVLAGYEDALTSLGLRPGLVELCGMALLSASEAASAPGDRLIVNWDDEYLSLLLARSGQPVLVRTLTGEAATAPDDVVREVANTVLFYRERLKGAGLDSVLVRSAHLSPEATIEMLREAVGTTPAVLDPWAGAGGIDGGPHAQAVAGAVACLVGKPL